MIGRIFINILYFIQSYGQAPNTCDLCHMARSCSAYNATHTAAHALSPFPLTMKTYDTLLSSAETKGPCVCRYLYNPPNLDAS